MPPFMFSVSSPLPQNPGLPSKPPRSSARVRRYAIGLSICAAIASISTNAQGQASPSPLTSREDLNAAVAQAERAGNPLQAAAIRQRLRDGDFQAGDRILLTIISDAPHTDTVVVRSGPVIDLPGRAVLSLSGVLRSELKDRVTTEVLKYVKAVQVEVTPLTRIAVLGEVTRPGYFALRSDIPITDAIMIAGGPTGSADIERSFVRRASREYRSAEETRLAVARGSTLDQLGMNAGDELVVGRQRQFISPSTSAVVGMIASLGALFIAFSHR